MKKIYKAQKNKKVTIKRRWLGQPCTDKYAVL